MSAVFIWLGIPFIIAIFAFLFRRYPDVAYPLVMMTCVLLIGLSFFVTIDEPFDLGESTIVIQSSTVFLGRLLAINASDISLVNFFYFLTFIWMFAGWRIRPNRFFPGLGFMIIVSLLSTLFIQPAFYAGFIFLIVAFLFIPLWVKAGTVPSRGVYRFLVMMFFGLPFFFLAGWQFSKIQLGLDNSQFIVQGGVFLSLGVLAFLSAFPLHSWIPMISEDTDPMILGFFMTTFPFIVMRFFMNQVSNYDLLVLMGDQFQRLWLIVAVITMFVGSFGAALSKKIVRFFAYYLIFSVGISLAGLALFDGEAFPIEMLWWFAVLINSVSFVIAVHQFGKTEIFELDFDTLSSDETYHRPVVILFFILLPMLLVPLSMGFVGFFGIFERVGLVANWVPWMMLISWIGILVFVIRYMINLVSTISWKQFKLIYSSEDDVADSDIMIQNRWIIAWISIYYLLQILFGVFPRMFEIIGIL